MRRTRVYSLLPLLIIMALLLVQAPFTAAATLGRVERPVFGLPSERLENDAIDHEIVLDPADEHLDRDDTTHMPHGSLETSEVARPEIMIGQSEVTSATVLASPKDLTNTDTIDLSTTTTSGKGYTVSGKAAPYTNPNWPAQNPDRGLAFTTAANGGIYRIIQSGLRATPPDKNAPKQDTAIFVAISIPQDVKVTLVLSEIDLAGSITLTGSGNATIMLDGLSYIRRNVAVPAGTQVTFDSLCGSVDHDVLKITSTANAVNSQASIGANAGANAGTININGATIDITARSSGAGIGGGGANAFGIDTGGHGGTIAINGGVVSVVQYGSGNDMGTGIGGAGIGGGGGNSVGGGNGGMISITGGTVKVIQYTRGAGIGGGTFATAGNITIDGGDIDVAVVNRFNQTHAGEGAAIGSAAGTNAPGRGQITINGGTVRAVADYTAIGKVHGHNGPSLDITITGGLVYAYGNKGPGIGYWSPSNGDTITMTGGTIYADSLSNVGIGGDNDTNLRLDEGANVRAYSGATPAAINTKDNQGNGYFINASLVTAPSTSKATTLEVYEDAGASGLLKTLTLPAAYRNFAYSCDRSTPRIDNILAKGSSSVLGMVVRDRDSNLQIYAIKTRGGYNAHNNSANNMVLPVRIATFHVITEKYVDEQGVAIAEDTISQVSLSSASYTKAIPPKDGYTVLGYAVGSYIPPNYIPGQSILIDPVIEATTVFFVYRKMPTEVIVPSGIPTSNIEIASAIIALILTTSVIPLKIANDAFNRRKEV
ncbi:MAG: hypothetical protein FWD41_04875 [Actinomycetia bacterium]|nr:hypothetical protein [Actinomycetes bacterium]